MGTFTQGRTGESGVLTLEESLLAGWVISGNSKDILLLPLFSPEEQRRGPGILLKMLTLKGRPLGCSKSSDLAGKVPMELAPGAEALGP